MQAPSAGPEDSSESWAPPVFPGTSDFASFLRKAGVASDAGNKRAPEAILIEDRAKRISSVMDQSLVDAKIAASEARTDAKFAELRGDMRTGFADIRTDFAGILGEIKEMRADIGGRLDHVEKATSGLRANIWFAAIAAVGLVAAMLAWGGDQFGRGLDIGRNAPPVQTQQAPPIPALPAPPTQAAPKQ